MHELGLTALYMANDDVKKFVGMMDGLAFLPVQDIAAGVVIVRNFMPNPALAPLLTYFLQTYVGVWVLNANNQMVSRPPLFPLLSWNVYTITLNGGSRTSNVCEGWNNSFRLLVGQHHPPLYKCIEALQRDNAIVRTHMAQSTNGTRHRTPVKRNYVTSRRKLQRACQAYQQGRYANNMQLYLERILTPSDFRYVFSLCEGVVELVSRLCYVTSLLEFMLYFQGSMRQTSVKALYL